jgi:hypothetical protein
MLWFLWDQSKRKASEEKKEFSFSPPPSTKPEGMVAQLWWHMVEVLSAKAGIAGKLQNAYRAGARRTSLPAFS